MEEKVEVEIGKPCAEKPKKPLGNTKIDIDRYRAKEGEKINLKKFPTACDVDVDKEAVKTVAFPKALSELSILQAKLYAQSTYGLVIVLQAMDAAGKDGTIAAVLTCLNPHGVSETAFKSPSSVEQSHDFLWRIEQHTPSKGEIAIFNRSHYEEVLVQRVKKMWKTQAYADRIDRDEILENRYEDIRNYEKYLYHNSIRVVKLFLNVSKKEQARRFLSRIEEPEKNWKFSASDFEERQYWDEYQKAFEAAINKTATKESPWYVVPADHKWYMRYVVSEIILHTLKKMDPKYPEVTKERLEQFAEYKEQLEKELGK